MPVRNLYSYRKKVSDGEISDVYVYDHLTKNLRVQIVQIWRDAFGNLGDFEGEINTWKTIHDIVAKEHGVFKLYKGNSYQSICEGYLLIESSVDLVLDLVEMSFKFIDRTLRQYTKHSRNFYGIEISADDAIDELNERFRRASVGYSFEMGKIIRIDSDLIHSEVVKPALSFLSEQGFEGPREEFLKAHTHYRNGENKDAITNANNAFESTIKTVCDQRGWEYESGAPISNLLKILYNQGLLPNYLEDSFKQLTATLRSGLPRIRNNESGHGQGAAPRETPAYVAAFALHLAAVNIRFIIDAHKAMKA